MLYIHYLCPPLPHLICGGLSMFRKGDIHERRIMQNAFDLIFVRSGKLYMDENNQKYVLEPGDYLILPPNNIHKGYKACDEETMFSWLHFYTEGHYAYSNAAATSKLDKLNKYKYYKKDEFIISVSQHGTINPEDFSALERYMESISQVKIDKFQREKLFYHSIVSELEGQIYFLKILSLLSSMGSDKKKDFVSDIYDYLVLNYQQSITLENISQIFSFHPAHIIRSVKGRYGMSPLQLLLEIRINAAKQLLTDSDKTIHQIGEDVGFGDSSYFTKQFKKRIGVTPLEYRKSTQKKD